MRRFIANHQIIAFWILTYAISWLGFGLTASLGIIGNAPGLLTLLVSFAPSLAGIALIASIEGKAGLKNVGRRLLQWRVGVKWYIVVFLLPIVLCLVGLMLFPLFGDPIPSLAIDPASIFGHLIHVIPALGIVGGVLLLFIGSFFVGGALNEEIGWRGYALPRLQTRYGAWWASIIIGIFWATWHIPVFWMQGRLFSNLPQFVFFVLSIMAVSIIATWLYNHTQGSIFFAVLFHATFDTASTALPLPYTLMEMAVILWVAALILVVVFGPARLSRQSLPAPCILSPQEQPVTQSL